MKRKLALALAVIFALLSFTACGQTAENPAPITDSASDSPAVEAAGRIKITLGSYGNGMSRAVRDFNTSQDEYIIELIDYSQGREIDRNQAVIKLNADLATGNAPDVISLFNFHINPAIYGSKGYFEDLYPYIDADPELNREDFVQSLFKAYESDGALYQTLTSFSVLTMLTSKSIADSIPEWTFENMIALSEEKGGDVVFGSGFSKLSFLSGIMLGVAGEYVDYSSGTASFDSDGFKSLLELCNTMGKQAQSDDDGTSMMQFFAFSNFFELQYYEHLFGDEVSFIGYPSSEGSVSFFGNVADLDMYSINSASMHKDAVWQFVRILLTEEYQDSHTYEIPSNLKSLQKDKEYATIPIIDEETQTEIPRQGDHDFTYYAATDAQVEQMLELIDSATAPIYSDSTISEIIREETQAYFNGAKTVDEVASLIQSRVSLYLGEIS